MCICYKHRLFNLRCRKCQLYFASERRRRTPSTFFLHRGRCYIHQNHYMVLQCTYQSVSSKRQICTLYLLICYLKNYILYFLFLFDHFIILTFFLDSFASYFRGEATNAKESSWILMCLCKFWMCFGVVE